MNKVEGAKRPSVVLPVCDEAFGNAVADFAINQVWDAPPIFHLLFVVELDGLPVIAPALVDDLTESEKEYGCKLMAPLANKIKAACPEAEIVRHFEKGVPETVILALAKDVCADLIVIGSHARTGLKRLLLGSVSAAVVERANCSTVVVRVPDAIEPVVLVGPAGLECADLPESMTSFSCADS